MPRQGRCPLQKHWGHSTWQGFDYPADGSTMQFKINDTQGEATLSVQKTQERTFDDYQHFLLYKIDSLGLHILAKAGAGKRTAGSRCGSGESLVPYQVRDKLQLVIVLEQSREK